MLLSTTLTEEKYLLKALALSTLFVNKEPLSSRTTPMLLRFAVLMLTS